MEIELHQLETKYAGLRIADRGRIGRLMAALCAHGQRQPVLVVRAGDPADAVARYVLIDGYARVAALAVGLPPTRRGRSELSARTTFLARVPRRSRRRRGPLRNASGPGAPARSCRRCPS